MITKSALGIKLILLSGMGLLLSACSPTPVVYDTGAATVPEVKAPERVVITENVEGIGSEVEQQGASDFVEREVPVLEPDPISVPTQRQKTQVSTAGLQDSGRVQVETYQAPVPVRKSTVTTTQPYAGSGRVQVERLPTATAPRNNGQVQVERYQTVRPTETTTRTQGQVGQVSITPIMPPASVVRPAMMAAVPSASTASTTTPAAVAPRDYPYSPAVKSLVSGAQSAIQQGNVGMASDYIERALRIDDQNPRLWLLMAQIKRSSGDNPQAISMAQKAMQVAGDDEGFQQRTQAFIASVR